MRNPTWTTTELILALELYFEWTPLKTSENNPKIVALIITQSAACAR